MSWNLRTSTPENIAATQLTELAHPQEFLTLQKNTHTTPPKPYLPNTHTLSPIPDAAKLTLQRAASSVPCGFTFYLLQRFVRRTEGPIAARRCFIDYLAAQGYSSPIGGEASTANLSASGTVGGTDGKDTSDTDKANLFIGIFIAQAQLEQASEECQRHSKRNTGESF